MAQNPMSLKARLVGTDVRVVFQVTASSGYILSRRYAPVSGGADAVFYVNQVPLATIGDIDELVKDDSTDTRKFEDGPTGIGHIIGAIPHGNGVVSNPPLVDNQPNYGRRGRGVNGLIELRMVSTLAATFNVELMWAERD